MMTAIAVTGEPRGRYGLVRAARMEWIKLRSLRSTWWTLAITAAGTISIGIAVYEQDARFRRDLIEFADAALYAAKSQGRNRLVLYSELAQQQRREVS